MFEFLSDKLEANNFKWVYCRQQQNSFYQQYFYKNCEPLTFFRMAETSSEQFLSAILL